MEILVDAYTQDERAVGWHHYLTDHMTVPFDAQCIEEREISPLDVGETVRVLGMSSLNASQSDMIVMVMWRETELGVPLTQLEPIDVDHDTQQAIADWHYWKARGYQIV